MAVRLEYPSRLGKIWVPFRTPAPAWSICRLPHMPGVGRLAGKGHVEQPGGAHDTVYSLHPDLPLRHGLVVVPHRRRDLGGPGWPAYVVEPRREPRATGDGTLEPVQKTRWNQARESPAAMAIKSAAMAAKKDVISISRTSTTSWRDSTS